MKKHEELQASNEEARENIEKLREANNEYLNLVNEYKIKEDKLNEDREKLQEDMKKLQQAVAEGNKDVFMEFFERMDQQAAQEIYEKVLRERSGQKKKLADIVSGMEPESWRHYCRTWERKHGYDYKYPDKYGQGIRGFDT